MQPREWNEIVKGNDWQMSWQYSANAQSIQSSTYASPIVVTVNQHGYSNGDKIRIYGHNSNKAANGNWTLANVTANTFELVGTSGSGAGRNDGFTSKAIDATGATLTVTLNDKPIDGTPVLTLTPTWIDQTICHFSIALTDAQTSALTQSALYLRIKFTDSLGIDTTIVAETLKVITL